MQLTEEQRAIIQSEGDIKINAVAGSGKTTTIIEYAKARKNARRILYLAFNRSVRIEATEKFIVAGLNNVQIETAHSLAYKNVVFRNGYQVRSNGYKTHEIVETLGITGYGSKHAEYILANHINKFATYFCNSDKAKIQNLNYLDVVSDPKASEFVSRFYDELEYQTRLFLSKMDSGEIEITHDFYLKKFQLSRPKLPFDYILFDEGQDASPAMLDIFLRQNATKVLVGDSHQQIYGWRHAVNSLEKADFKRFRLSTSFRFKQEIANLAMAILKWKNQLSDSEQISISGKGSSDAHNSRAILARTNLGLLLKAIEYVQEKRNVRHIYFEGNINSYTYADDGTSLYDVLNLHNGTRRRIRDKLIQTMTNLAELEEYIEQTGDHQLGMMVDIVKEYGNKIPGIIRSLKDKHVGDNEKDQAEMIFSTVHRSKGMEYDTVQLVDDFITEERLENLASRDDVSEAKLNEEVNLLYVAITRTKNSIYLPEMLMPKDFPRSADIHILQSGDEQASGIPKRIETAESSWEKRVQAKPSKDKSYTVEQVRKTHTNAYRPWTEALDEELTVMYCEGVNIRDMAKHFSRTKGAIRSRIKKLDLERLYG